MERVGDIEPTIEKLKETYSFRLGLNKTQHKKATRKANLLTWIRVAVFIFILIVPYKLYPISPYLFWALLIISITAFIALIKKHGTAKLIAAKFKHLTNINNTELEVLKHDFSNLTEGNEFINPEHNYSHDLDLFGNGSIFQYINRSGTIGGAKKLAYLLENPSTQKEKIYQFQDAIKELTPDVDFRQNYWATAAIMEETHELQQQFLKWNKQSVCFSKPRVPKRMAQIFSALTLLVVVLMTINLIPWPLLGLWFTGGLVVTGNYFKRISTYQNQISNLKNILTTYGKLLKMLEERSFSTPLLKQWQTQGNQAATNASKAIAKLVKQIEMLDQRTNMIAGILLNGLFLWDIHIVIKIDQWVMKWAPNFEKWMQSIYHFDALLCLANYSYNHETFVFPGVTDEISFECKELGHPLIPTGERINNDFLLTGNSQISIVTGANMAGKSTFLRTVGLNLVLAGCGAPVCAKSFTFHPLPLLTNMRTTDSLAKHESYFFAELKRLQYIIETLKKGQPLFLIIDEMLKGTNSKDKTFGSIAMVRQLVKYNGYGLIATHDLELGDLETEFRGEVNNLCFEVIHEQDKIVFDYKLKPGVTTVHNATFLMKKMGIIPKDDTINN